MCTKERLLCPAGNLPPLRQKLLEALIVLQGVLLDLGVNPEHCTSGSNNKHLMPRYSWTLDSGQVNRFLYIHHMILEILIIFKNMP